MKSFSSQDGTKLKVTEDMANPILAPSVNGKLTHKEREVMMLCRWVKLGEESKAALIGKLTEEEIIRLRKEVSKTFIDALNSINS